MTDLLASAREWIAGDPDPESASDLEKLVLAGDVDALETAMGGVLEFGTAGIRGVVGPGSNQMNRAVVIKTTRGLANFLLERHDGPPDSPVIVGFDARPTSRSFAEATVGVLAASGIRAEFFPDPAPTPLVAFAARVLEAAAAVVITASHNPPADNGYKVYDSNAAQIIPPIDTAISTAIASVGRANDVPMVEQAFTAEHGLIHRIDSTIGVRYREEVDASRPAKAASTLRIVYTPLHGVGGATLVDVFERTVHRDLHVVEEQFRPDGTFPTVNFPNPEEPGAMDLAMKLGNEIDAELILANDPDADRLGAAVMSPVGWRVLTGNELGVLLGAHVLENWESSAAPITASSVVSSPMLSHLTAAAGGVHLTTLTGFKWIINAALDAEAAGQGVFVFGFEEALGFSVGRTVRDKDGISAALALADLASIEKAAGRSLLDRLADLWATTGIWVSTQKSIVREGDQGAHEIVRAVDYLASSPADRLGGYRVTEVTDFRRGAEDRPRWLGSQALVELELGDAGRVLARPSGTEPKLKIYVDLRRDVAETGDVHTQREALLREASEIADYLAEVLASSMTS